MAEIVSKKGSFIDSAEIGNDENFDEAVREAAQTWPLFPAEAPLFRNLSLNTKDTIKIQKPGKADKICRVVEGQIPEDLATALKLDFTASEIFEIAHRCNVYGADESNEKPKALWLFGPPAVGKTTISNEKARDLFGQTENAVTIDGDIFRKVHKGFQMVALHGFRNGLIHKDAWSTLKKSGIMDKIKEGIVDHAMQNHQHLKIPDACTSMVRIHSMLDTLEEEGYEMHAVCLWAPKSTTEERGRPRSVKEGKVFNVDMYDGSTKHTLAMAQFWEERIASGSPNYKSIAYYDNTTFPSDLISATEFKQLTSMTDDEATEHAVMCDLAKQSRHLRDLAASEARALGTSAPRPSPRHGGTTHQMFSRYGQEPSLFLSELRRGRVEGFLSGVFFASLALMGVVFFRGQGRRIV